MPATTASFESLRWNGCIGMKVNFKKPGESCRPVLFYRVLFGRSNFKRNMPLDTHESAEYRYLYSAHIPELLGDKIVKP